MNSNLSTSRLFCPPGLSHSSHDPTDVCCWDRICYLPVFYTLSFLPNSYRGCLFLVCVRLCFSSSLWSCLLSSIISQAVRRLLIPRLWVTAHRCRSLLVWTHWVWSYFTLVTRCIKFYKEASSQYRSLFLMTPSDPLSLLNNDLTLQGLHSAHNSTSRSLYHPLWDKWGIDLAKWTWRLSVKCHQHLCYR